ncbi:MAG: signal recognition particle protein [Planctomycetaceae bacterium]|nr:signal recognition particle protein [Planctomycetaceae bacterium]
MFEALTEKFNGVFRSLTGRGRITEANVSEAMREVRKALLEADVNYNVVKQFVKDVQQAAMGAEVIKSLHPGQVMVKIVNDELTRLMGPVDPKIYYVSPGPTVIMMAGLQGSGKTTTAAKLAKLVIEKDKKRVMMIADDLQRPAAIEQLCLLGEQVGVEVYKEDGVKDAVRVAKNGVKYAKEHGYDAAILDTAGRLHIDEEMMNEIAAVAKAVTPQQIYLVCDAMTGQDAVNSAKEFNERLELDGVILTKLDGDARGGAALSVKAVTGKPIKFIGVGEKLDKLEAFHPDRMAGRILGMGDVVSLVEKAQEQFDAEQAQKLQVKMAKGTFGFDDFLKQMQSVRKMGGFGSLLKMLPGMGGLANMDFDDREINKIEGIVHSMTKDERTDPDLIDSSRRRRIARGSGRDVQDVAGLIKTFKRSREMMRMMAGGAGAGGMNAMKNMLSGKTDMFSAMSSMKKVKQRSKRKRQPRRKR